MEVFRLRSFGAQLRASQDAVIIIALIPLALSVACGTGHWARRRCCGGTCSFHTSSMPGAATSRKYRSA
jgi:hypothetical protein